MTLPIDLQKNEEIVKEYKRHPVFLIKQLLMIALAGIVPILIVGWLSGFIGFIDNISNPVSILWAIGAIIAGLVAWYSYENDRWFITNQRIIDLNKRNVFNTTVAAAELVNVLDMTIRQRGILASMFKYGDVECQTAGAGNLFVMRGVENPQAALNLIDSTRDQARIDIKHTANQAYSANANA